MEFEVWTDAEAVAVGGNSLEVPNDAPLRVLKRKGVEYTVKEWWEVGSIVGVDEPVSELDDRVGCTRQTFKVRIKQAGASFSSSNKGRFLPSARFRFWPDLRFEKKSELEEAAERSGSTTSKESAKFYTFQEFMKNSQGIAKFLKALGYQGKLAGGAFRGLGSIVDVIPEFTGRQLGVQIRQGDLWGDGVTREEIVSYRVAD